MSVPDLQPWGDDVIVAGRLGGGSRNEVWRVRIDGDVRVARRSRRSTDSLEWELDLLDHVSGHGFTVPTPVLTRLGERRVGTLVVTPWVGGDPPSTDGDWALVAAELRRLHKLTIGWPQRPGFASARELVHLDSGGDVDLREMPDDAVETCRSAWLEVPSEPMCVIHGDPGESNVRVQAGSVAIIDWDEARVDHPWFDLADIPSQPLPPDARPAACRAANAWEAANGWQIEPDYARRRLARLLARS